MEYEKLANDFALTHGVTMAFSYVEEVYDNKAVIDGSTKWNIMLSSPTHTFSFQFFMGPANEAEPSIYVC